MNAAANRAGAFRSLSRHKSQSGFSMLEVLISLLILGIGLLGLASLQAVGMQNNHSAYLRSHASILSYEIIDSMRSNRDRAVNQAFDVGFNDTPGTGGENQAEQDLNDWLRNVAANLPDGRAEIRVTADGDVRVEIRWLDDRRAGAGEEEDGDAEAQEGRFVYATQI